MAAPSHGGLTRYRFRPTTRARDTLPAMTKDQTADEIRVHDATKIELADGALAQIRSLHRKNAQLLAEREDNRPLTVRVARGLRRARRNGWRVHRYPRDFRRGMLASKTSKLARADIDRLMNLITKRKYGQAIAFAAALLPDKGDDKEFLETARLAFTRAGAMSLQVAAVAALRAQGDSSGLKKQELTILSRIRETEPGWLPFVPRDLRLREDPQPGRVLHLLKVSMPHRQSGYTMRSQYILDSQRAGGLDPVAMTALGFPRQIGNTDGVTYETVNGTPHHRLDVDDPDELSRFYDTYLDAYAEAAATRIVDISPSVLHVHSGHHGYEPALVGLALARQFDLPMIYEVRGFFESTWSSDLAWNERGEIYARRYATETRCMREADAVVTLSESMRSEIVARGVPADNVFVVPNGVDIENFHPQPRSEALVERLGLAGKFTFGYVSNLDHYREGHEALIQAAAELRRRGVPAVALIVGDGSRREELEALAASEDAGDSVIFTGRVPHDEVLDYYRLLDVFVVPRVPERAARLVTPLKPFEAMAAGLPIVVSDLEALLEIVGDGERGRAFEAGNATSLADVLQELQVDPDLRADLAKRGRDWVIAERQWSVNAKRYADIYAAIGTPAH